MVLEMAKPKNKQSTIWLGMRGRDVARKLTLKVNILQVFTIDFSEFQFIVNHNRMDRTNVSRDGRIWKIRPYTSSHSRGKEKIPRTMVSYLEQSMQKWAYETSTWFSSRCHDEKSSTPRIRRTSWRTCPSRSIQTNTTRTRNFHRRLLIQRTSCVGISSFHASMMTSRTRDTRPNHTTTGLALWSSLTLETRSHPWAPAVHGLVRQGGCGWPDFHHRRQATGRDHCADSGWL